MKPALWIVALICVAGCAHRMAERQQMLAGFVGHREADVVRAFGVPTQTFDTDGRRFLAYVDNEITVLPGSYGVYPFGPWGPGAWNGGLPPQVIQSICQTVFEISDGKVVGVGLHGNGCD